MASALPTARELGVTQLQPNLGVASYRGATGLEDDRARGLLTAAGQFGAVAQHLEKAQEEFDVTQAEDRYNQLKGRLNEIALDPQSGWKTAKGENALKPEFVQKYTTMFEDERQRIAGTLQTPKAKERFNRLAQSAVMQSRASMYEHTANERVKYATQVFNDTLKLEKDGAWQSHGNDAAFEAGLARVRSTTEAFARNWFVGANDVTIKGSVQEAESGMWAQRIEGALTAGNWPLAKELRDRVERSGNLTTADKQAIDSKIKQIAIPQERAQIAAEASNGFLVQARRMDVESQATPTPSRDPAMPGQSVPIKVPAGIERYRDVFEAAGRASNVDPRWLMAMGTAESGGDPNARNRGDALKTGYESQGMMQFQPPTATQYGVKDPFNPNEAIPGSARYMKVLLDRYGGDYEKATAAYNMGEGAFDKATAGAGGEWKQRLPQSTQAYLRKISGIAGQPSAAIARDPRFPNATDTTTWLRVNMQTAYDQAYKAWLNKYPWDAVGANLAGNEAHNNITREIHGREQNNKAAFETLGHLALAIDTPEGQRPSSQAEFEARLTPETRKMWDESSLDHKRTVLVILKHNQMAKLGEEKQSDPATLNDVTRKVTSKEITSIAQLAPYMAIPAGPGDAGREGISKRDYGHLASMIHGINEPGKQTPFEVRKNDALHGVQRAVATIDGMNSLELQAPGFTGRAVILWKLAVEEKQKEYETAKKDPMLLFDPAHADNVVNTKFLEGIISKASQRVSEFTPEQLKNAVRLPSDRAKASEMIAKLPEHTLMEMNGQYRWKGGPPGSKPAGAAATAAAPAQPRLQEERQEPAFKSSGTVLTPIVDAYKNAMLSVAIGIGEAYLAAPAAAINTVKDVVSALASLPGSVRKQVYATMFRNLLRLSPSYSPEHLPYIENALSSGLLTPEEDALANRMKENILKAK